MMCCTEPVTCDNKTQFTCQNGRCVEAAWRCDGDNDCLDMSDELDCDHSMIHGRSCRSYEFQCAIIHECVHRAWLCDGDFDCQDHSDENTTYCKCLLLQNYTVKISPHPNHMHTENFFPSHPIPTLYRQIFLCPTQSPLSLSDSIPIVTVFLPK